MVIRAQQDFLNIDESFVAIYALCIARSNFLDTTVGHDVE